MIHVLLKHHLKIDLLMKDKFYAYKISTLINIITQGIPE